MIKKFPIVKWITKMQKTNCQTIHFHKKSVFAFCCRAVQCRPLLRQWHLNPKEIEGKNWNCRKVDYKKKVVCVSSFSKTDMNLFSQNRLCVKRRELLFYSPEEISLWGVWNAFCAARSASQQNSHAPTMAKIYNFLSKNCENLFCSDSMKYVS